MVSFFGIPITIKRNKIYIFKRVILTCATFAIFLLAHRLLKSIETEDKGGKGTSSNIEITANGKDYRIDVHLHPTKHKRKSFFRNLDKTRKDWHDYKFIEMEKQRVGVGEHGVAVNLSNYDPAEVKRQLGLGGFNGAVSDDISVNRSVPDIRHLGCRNKKYLVDLPIVSVIVIFYNEYWSTLLRTCYGVLNRSPPHLIHEIVLVDDGSTWPHLKDQLDEYVAKYLPKVMIQRIPQRTGLINARIVGAAAATGDVFLFLDSHCEPNTNWLPPLLEPIAENYRVATCPFIDSVDHITFEYSAQDDGQRGAFDWQLYYKRIPLLLEDYKYPTKPFRSPVMAGGLFAISAKFYRELGGYDAGIVIWGGEQYELSFKIWQCGGELLDVPCSRVGHVYRGPQDPKPPARSDDFLHRNYMRMAEVWMDEYKEHVYKRDAEAYAKIDPGDLTHLKALRQNLECKSFKWFIEEVASDLVRKFPPIDPPDYASGAVQSLKNPLLCIDTLNLQNDNKIGIYKCASNLTNPQFNQMFILTGFKDIRSKNRDLCWDRVGGSDASVQMVGCHRSGGNQQWRYDHHKKWIEGQNEGFCLALNEPDLKVSMLKCDDKNLNLRWEFAVYNETALDNYHTSPLYKEN